MSTSTMNNNIVEFKKYVSENPDTSLEELLETKGFDTVADCNYALANELSCNPRCSLNKNYNAYCKQYLKDAFYGAINYIRTGSTYYVTSRGEGFVTTKYSRNILEAAIACKDQRLINSFKPDNEKEKPLSPKAIEAILNGVYDQLISIRQMEVEAERQKMEEAQNNMARAN